MTVFRSKGGFSHTQTVLAQRIRLFADDKAIATAVQYNKTTHWKGPSVDESCLPNKRGSSLRYVQYSNAIGRRDATHLHSTVSCVVCRNDPSFHAAFTLIWMLSDYTSSHRFITHYTVKSFSCFSIIAYGTPYRISYNLFSEKRITIHYLRIYLYRISS